MNAKKVFGVNGIISQHMGRYEVRVQQEEMFESIVDAMKNNQHLIIEAGTGVGKTFAYLVPAIEYSVSFNEPVVISTNTINLQEQIFYKDIPFLKDILGHDFKSALVKGRRNYLCLRRLNRATNYQSDLF